MEVILNIYILIENGLVVAFKAKSYEQSGDDDDKINFLKSHAKDDYESAVSFDAPCDDNGKFMKYKRFAKFEKQGMHMQLFEKIFSAFDIPENPLICVTPVEDGEILS